MRISLWKFLAPRITPKIDRWLVFEISVPLSTYMAILSEDETTQYVDSYTISSGRVKYKEGKLNSRKEVLYGASISMENGSMKVAKNCLGCGETEINCLMVLILRQQQPCVAH